MPTKLATKPTALELADEAWARIESDGRKRVRACLEEANLEIPYFPDGTTVLVVRLPPPPVETTYGQGLLVKPDRYQEDPEPKSEGVLIAAGLTALDALREQGIVVGDRVQIGRFAGWEKEFDVDGGHLTKSQRERRKILQMEHKDIKGSFDLNERLNGPKPSLEIIFQDGEYIICPIV